MPSLSTAEIEDLHLPLMLGKESIDVRQAKNFLAFRLCYPWVLHDIAIRAEIEFVKNFFPPFLFDVRK